MRRFVRVCVSTLVAVTLLGAVAVLQADEKKPAAGSATEPSAKHTAAVAKITEAGGAVRRIAQNTDENEVSLALAPPPVSDKLMSAVADVDNVVWLELQGTSITDDGLKKIGGMKMLRRLHLERTGITDAGLKYLKDLSELEYLNVYGTKVSDKGLEHVKSLKRLRKIYVWATEVSEEGMAKLTEAMPDLAVIGAAKPLTAPPVVAEKKMEAEEKKTEKKKPESKTIAAPEVLLAAGIAVRVTVPSEHHLSLAEVEVYPVGKTEKLKGKAEQSSTHSNGGADRALDGNRDGVYSSGSVTHTDNAGNEWWKVTFPESKDIGSIHIWNRSDCCGNRLSGAVVEILDEDDKVVWSDKIETGTDGGTYEFVGK